jgi:hypothetical protein
MRVASALPSQPIDVRRPRQIIAKRSNARAQVFHHQQDDVRLLTRCLITWSGNRSIQRA